MLSGDYSNQKCRTNSHGNISCAANRSARLIDMGNRSFSIHNWCAHWIDLRWQSLQRMAFRVTCTEFNYVFHCHFGWQAHCNLCASHQSAAIAPFHSQNNTNYRVYCHCITVSIARQLFARLRVIRCCVQRAGDRDGLRAIHFSVVQLRAIQIDYAFHDSEQQISRRLVLGNFSIDSTFHMRCIFARAAMTNRRTRLPHTKITVQQQQICISKRHVSYRQASDEIKLINFIRCDSRMS